MKAKKFFSIISTIAIMISIPFSAAASSNIKGDVNGDNKLDIRDAAYISKSIVTGTAINSNGDYNEDGKINIRDAASISRDLVKGKNLNVKVEENSTANEILTLVNQERAKVGVAPLKLSSELNSIANERAVESSNYFSHTRPNGESCFSIFEDNDIDYSYCGENLAAGNSTAKETVEQWINSPGHYANMIDPEFTELGVGFYHDDNSTYKYYWVQVFVCP